MNSGSFIKISSMRMLAEILDSAGRRAGALAVLGVVLLAGCGQKGPLYLPTGEAAVGRATLPEAVLPSRPASAPTGSDSASPASQP
jgi:predicted small lipoprotein YifL